MILLSEVATRLPVIDVACNRYDRRGRLRTDRLVAEHGAGTPIPALLRIIAAVLTRMTEQEWTINVPPADMAAVRVSPAGYGIKLDSHDINISVHGLIGSLATAGDMAALLGKLGGAPRSEAKRISARANGANGGRPRKVRTA